VSCPRCGGQARSPIAPGYWLCESLVTWDQPDRRGWSIPERVTGTCGNTYQEATPGVGGAPACSCGTDSIGSCTNCERRVCGIHSRLSRSVRVCDTCMPAVRKQREQEEAEKEVAYTAHLATLPSMGAAEFADLCRTWATFNGARDAWQRISEIRWGRAPDDRGYVLRPMQGRLIAQALADLKVPTYTDQIRKWYSSKWQPHENLGWQIWQSSVPFPPADSNAYVSSMDYPFFCMSGDGTVRECRSRYGGAKGQGSYVGSVVVRVIPPSTYWGSTVLREITAYLREYPGTPMRVSGQQPKEPLYADRMDAWPAK
jgi:hypothetical protein